MLIASQSQFNMMKTFSDRYERRFRYGRFAHSSELTIERKEKLRKLLELNPNERQLDNFLNDYPAFFIPLFTYYTSHHGIWVFPKQTIVPKVKGVQNGLIPDWIICTETSDGYVWWIVELKSPKHRIFSGTGSNYGFSSYVTKGLSQLLRYIDFCTEHQSMLRDVLKLKYFREPRGILLIGRLSEYYESIRKKNLKSIWNRLSPQIQIRTYEFLLFNA